MTIARAWNEKLDSTLRKFKFQQNEHEHAICCRGDKGGRLIVKVSVGDLVITSITLTEIKKFKAEMKAQFKMTDLALLTFYLGMEVQQSSGRIVLCQAHYTMRNLEAAGMEKCNSTHTPMEEGLKFSQNN
jgi:hypothetical protein